MKLTKRGLALVCTLAMLLQLFAGLTFVSAEEAAPAAAPAEPKADPIPIYEDTSYSFAERAADLVARMSLSQKGSQMISSPAPAINASALGGGALSVPATKSLSQYYWWNEGLHGYNRIDNGASVRGGGAGPANATSYPQSLTVGSTWNPELYYQEALQVSDEIRERTSRSTQTGNAIDLNFYSPTVNLQRDPRWGRNEESYSEDPYLTVKMGSQYVLGLEGKNPDGSMIDPDGYYRLHSTIKHYVANNSESNRLNGGATTSLDALHNYYLAPYRGIIKATDVSSVMTAYSSLNGEPCSYSSYLMDTVLRQMYGFSGHITSDCDAVGTMTRLNYRNPRTGNTLTNQERLAGALAHGEDLECNGGYTGTGNYNSYSSQMLGVATDKGTFTENTIDISLHRLMTARISTGEFDDNLALTQAATARIAAQQAADSSGVYNQTPERLAIMDQVNNEGVVMLQNKDSFLPLQIPSSGDYKVVIVGAWQTNMYLGLYSASANNTAKQINIQKGISDAIKAKNPNASFTYVTSDSVSESNRAAIEAADVVFVVGGANNQYSAEDRDRSSIAMNNNQATMFNTVGQWNPNTVAIMEYCGPVETYTFKDNVKAILWSSFGGLHKGVGFGNIVVGNVNPSGKLTATWFHSTSDLPDKLNYDLYASGGVAGRTYMYYTGSAVDYPFGYGLSFTTFQYSDLTIDKTAYDANDTVKVSFKVKNTGTVAGKETAQLYIAQPNATAANRPIRRLEGFSKIELQPGETKTVNLEVRIPDLAYYNEADDCFSVDTGAYQVQVGKDSASANLTKNFTVSGAMNVYPEVLTVKANAVGDAAQGIEERLIYSKGDVINPQLTVAMNNQKLYGYIIKEQLSPIKKMQSTALPEGMTFTYSSNRPSVVKVTGDEIKAVGPGVATVTVTGTLGGTTVTADFIVYVMANIKVDEITIDGEPLPKFNPDKLSYNVTLTSKKIPVVAASANDPDLQVEVHQATELPGAATVVVTDSESGVFKTYTINFKVKATGGSSVTIDFSDEADASKYEIVGQSQSAVTGDGLPLITTRNAIETAGNQNSGAQAETPEDMVQVPVSGDWTATLEVLFNTNSARNGWYQFFGFFAAASDEYGTTDLAGIRGGDGALQDFVRSDGTITADTDLKSAPGFDTDGKTYFLRLQKEGTTYIASRSDDGDDWTDMFTLEDTGVEAEYLLIDAYTGMTAGYKFTLKNLTIEGVGGGIPSIDFTDPADEPKYEIVGQNQSNCVADEGVALITTRNAIETAGGQNSGAQAETPEDMVQVPVSGDWTATLEVLFNTNGARNGWYQFFGFFAAASDEYGTTDLAGIRGGDGALQDFVRSDGTITADTDLKSAPGFDTDGKTYFLQIEKVGTTYTCSRSDDGEDFTEMFVLEDTGVEAEYLLIDAYTGMTAGYKFTLKHLNFEGGSSTPKPVAAEVASITVGGEEIEFDPKVTAYNFEVEKTATAAPVVAATPGNSKTTVTVAQAEGPVGAAVITATAGEKTKTYTVWFNYGPEDDYFADGAVSDAWTVENELADEYQLVKGEGLKLLTQTEDIYQTGRGWHNAFTMPAMGNWIAVAKAFYPTAELEDYQQLAFALWQDEDNYVRVNLQQSRLLLEPGKETNGTMATTAIFSQANATAAEDGTVTIYFQIIKQGNDYTLGYSQDGAAFTSLGSVTANYANPKLVLIAGQNTDNPQTWLNFEYVAIVSKNGVDANSDFLTWARQNVADYVAADLPNVTDKDLTLAAVPHGYSVSISSSDPAVIDADGKVTQGAAEKEVTVTVTVTEGEVTATAEKKVKVAAVGQAVLDKTALEAAIAEAEKLVEAEYTADSWTAFAAALATAKEALSAETQAAIDAAKDALVEAQGKLVKIEQPPVLDKTALEAAITEAEKLKEADYTAETWAPFAAALAAAKTALTEAATQDAIDAAKNALVEAQGKLEKKPVEPKPEKYIDFTTEDDADKYEIIGQSVSTVREGEGLYMISTQSGIEYAGHHYQDGYEMLTGDAAKTPVDLVKIPVEGDWTATLNFNFAQNDSLGYYEFFGFYAGEDDELPTADLVGIRGADGDIQDFLRKGGEITDQQTPYTFDDGSDSGTGLKIGTQFWFRIQKVGDDYACAISTDGENFTEMFTLENTEIDAKYLIIDAYSSMQEGYTYMLRSLDYVKAETSVPVLKKSALQKAVATAEALKEADYTPETFAGIAAPLAAAKKALEEAKTQAEIDAAEAALTAAIDALVKVEPPLDKSKLEAAIADAEAVDKTKYTEDSVKQLETVLAAAKATLESAQSQDALNAAATAVQNAIDKLELLPDEPPFQFDDVKDESKFYYTPVYWAVNHDPQITNGATPTTFNPDGACTRGHVVTFLWRAAGEPEPTSSNNPFTDLKETGFYYKAVLWAVEKGITTGTSKTTFAPGKPCTRGQIVTFLWRYKGSPEPTTTENPFGDVKTDGFYYKAVLWAVENNVTSGTGKGKFSPDSTCTRGQVVTFLYRASGEAAAE